MEMLEQKYYYSKDNYISVLFRGSNHENANNLIIFPPGPCSAIFINNIIDYLPINVNIYSISFPNRGKSSINSKVKNISDISKAIIDTNLLLKENAILIGFSFGTAVIIELLKRIQELQKVHTVEYPNIREIILFNPGEFIGGGIAKVLKYIFKNASVSVPYARLLKKIVLSPFFGFESADFEDNRLIHINNQWLSILEWKLPESIYVPSNVILVVAEKDGIVIKESFSKLEKLFHKHEIVKYNGIHLMDYRRIGEWSFVPNVLKQIWMNL